jgi:hypothetical protein
VPVGAALAVAFVLLFAVNAALALRGRIALAFAHCFGGHTGAEFLPFREGTMSFVKFIWRAIWQEAGKVARTISVIAVTLPERSNSNQS